MVHHDLPQTTTDNTYCHQAHNTEANIIKINVTPEEVVAILCTNSSTAMVHLGEILQLAIWHTTSHLI